MVATAQTGSGKTAAYLLPLLGVLSRTSRDGAPKNKAYPAALVVVPTRELVDQVTEVAARLVKGGHLKVGVHGVWVGEGSGGEWVIWDTGDMVIQEWALEGGCWDHAHGGWLEAFALSWGWRGRSSMAALGALEASVWWALMEARVAARHARAARMRCGPP